MARYVAPHRANATCPQQILHLEILKNIEEGVVAVRKILKITIHKFGFFNFVSRHDVVSDSSSLRSGRLHCSATREITSLK
jgi:hypothetical protein